MFSKNLDPMIELKKCSASCVNSTGLPKSSDEVIIYWWGSKNIINGISSSNMES